MEFANPNFRTAFLGRIWRHLPFGEWRDQARAMINSLDLQAGSESSIVKSNFAKLRELRDSIPWERGEDYPDLVLSQLKLLHEGFCSALAQDLQLRAMTRKDLILASAARVADPGKRKYYERVVAQVEADFGVTVAIETVRTAVGRKPRAS